jgi:hypothetical protein
MKDTTRRTLRITSYAAALAACLVVGFFPFMRQESVPLLWAADLGFHELGHLLTMFWAPRVLTAAAGSAMQIAVPLGLAAYFLLARKERIAFALMLAWAGTSMANVATYIADAPYQQLELLGGPGGHDWAFLFGPEVLNDLPASGPVSTAVWIAGAAVVIFAAGLCAWGIVWEIVAWRRWTREQARLSTLPRREPRNPVLVLETDDGAPSPSPSLSPEDAAVAALIAQERPAGRFLGSLTGSRSSDGAEGGASRDPGLG